MALGRLALASTLSLSLLAAFLFAISALVIYFGDLYDSVGLLGIIALEALLFVFVWRFGPWLSDLFYSWLYKFRWLSPQELDALDPRLRQFLEEQCRKEGIKQPRFGLIEDDNPQAFTYGSDHWNARMVFTKGIFTFLNSEERRAVAAHELGHIVHRDFIVMTLASFILTLLYTIGRTLMRSGGSGNNRKGGGLALVGMLSLLFYYAGTYVLLYLSRTREYWADEYAKEKCGTGNQLSTALVKIAYGIVASKDGEKTRDLMEGTRTLGIYDHKAARNFGLVGADFVQNSDANAVVASMVYDLNNFWAFWLELSSSHPLTGKRIARLLEGEARPAFDMRAVRAYPFDHSRHRKEFAVDWLVSKAWVLLALGFAAVAYSASLNSGLVFLAGVAGAGAGLVVSALYRYPGAAGAPAKSIDSLMSDPYASPVRGKPCRIEGEIVGRGIPGYVFSEDVMLRDRTGLLYLDYTHWLPLLGNWFFAFTRVKSLVGKRVSCTGWFFRGFGQRMAIDVLEAPGEKIVGREKTWSLLVGALLFLAGGIFFFLGLTAA